MNYFTKISGAETKGIRSRRSKSLGNLGSNIEPLEDINSIIEGMSTSFINENPNILLVSKSSGDNELAVSNDNFNKFKDPWAARDYALVNNYEIIYILDGEWTYGNSSYREISGTNEYLSFAKSNLTFISNKGVKFIANDFGLMSIDPGDSTKYSTKFLGFADYHCTNTGLSVLLDNPSNLEIELNNVTFGYSGRWFIAFKDGQVTNIGENPDFFKLTIYGEFKGDGAREINFLSFWADWGTVNDINDMSIDININKVSTNSSLAIFNAEPVNFNNCNINYNITSWEEETIATPGAGGTEVVQPMVLNYGAIWTNSMVNINIDNFFSVGVEPGPFLFFNDHSSSESLVSELSSFNINIKNGMGIRHILNLEDGQGTSIGASHCQIVFNLDNYIHTSAKPTLTTYFLELKSNLSTWKIKLKGDIKFSDRLVHFQQTNSIGLEGKFTYLDNGVSNEPPIKIDAVSYITLLNCYIKMGNDIQLFEANAGISVFTANSLNDSWLEQDQTNITLLPIQNIS